MKYILAFLFVLTLSASVAAQTTYEQHMSQGMSGLEKKDYSLSEAAFRAALKEKPDDYKATLYLGVVLNRMGMKEAEDLLKRALLVNPREPETNLQLGIYYYNKSVYPEASDYFETTIELAPGTGFSASAEDYLRRMRGAETEKRWSLNLSIGGQYDSNVILNPSGNPLPQGISNKSDWSAVFLLNGRYYLIKDDKGEVSAGVSLYQNLHASLSDFNVTQPMVDVTAAYTILPWLQLRGVASYEFVWVGGLNESNRYGEDYMLAPSLVITEGTGFSTVIEYRYRNYNFYNSELFLFNSQRSGPDNYIGITQNLQITPSIQARLIYSHNVNATREDFWHYRGNRGALGLSFIFPYKIFMDLYGEYYVQDYRGKNPDTGENRKDKIFTGSIQATKVLSDIFSVTVGQLYTKDNSNLPAFDYNRAITSLFFTARF